MKATADAGAKATAAAVGVGHGTEVGGVVGDVAPRLPGKPGGGGVPGLATAGELGPVREGVADHTANGCYHAKFYRAAFQVVWETVS